MNEAITTKAFHCPACSKAFAWKPQFAGRKMRCLCGHVFMPEDPVGGLTNGDEYTLAAGQSAYVVPKLTPFAPPPPRADEARAAKSATFSPPVGAIESDISPAEVAAKYPHRRARPVAEEADPSEKNSPMRNMYVPAVLLALGVGLRVGQLLFANEGNGNRWAGNVATPGGFGKALLLVACEMIIASALTGLGAFAAATLLNLEFGHVGRAAFKLAATAVFATGAASWIVLFDQGAFSIGGLVLALHVVVVLNWIAMAYFFTLDLQEVLLAVTIITMLQAVAIVGLWRA